MTGDKTFAVTTSCYEQVVRVKAYYEFAFGKQLTFSECLSKMADTTLQKATTDTCAKALKATGAM